MDPVGVKPLAFTVEMEGLRIEEGGVPEPVEIQDAELSSGEGDRSLRPQLLQRPPDADRREAGRLAESGLRERPFVARLVDETDGAQAQEQFGAKPSARRATLRPGFARVRSGVPSRRRVAATSMP